MALPMLVGGGAECGPSNPLQGLTKQLDRDRGLQQDYFGAGRVGSSREVFRSQQGSVAQDQDAARFFSANTPHAPQLLAKSAFDLSAMHPALPMHDQPQVQPNPFSTWASDFMQSQPIHASSSQQIIHAKPNMDIQIEAQPMHSTPGVVPQSSMQWNTAVPNFRMNPMPTFMPQMPMQHHIQPQVGLNSKEISWDEEFSAHELHVSSQSTTVQEVVQEQQQRPAGEADELARTAGQLLENLKHEQNPKFQNSQFMGLMRQLRDGEVIVEGNQMVESDGLTFSKVDVKGKGRAHDPASLSYSNHLSFVTETSNGTLHSADAQSMDEERQGVQEDPNDAYFRQENADYTKYWNELEAVREVVQTRTPETMAWDKLQADWDNFEATTSGIKAITHYQFQENNPYLVGDSSRTRTHMLHTQGRASILENVLELEAEVQRNMSDASAWYELGVKQQENEREHKALQALQRAVELEPTHLPAWLALAVSYTNDNNRQGAYDAVYEWVSRNEKYKDAVVQSRAQTPANPKLSLVERYTQLIQCLIMMARSDTTGDIDADIQIALAVLLNTNEDYEKAQDCFRTALAVRPDDWLLYNRVGATMANSGRAEEALDYYYRALELNPGYIRARRVNHGSVHSLISRFNLGISCINLRRYEEAAQHILDALVLQDADGVLDNAGSNENRGVVSNALWDSLKTTCLHMQRADLATLCDLRDLEGISFRLLKIIG
ncbi:hypothetical protein CPB84DRAFT_1677396 [Gymnopilus junonius]|uniref:Peroxisomal targeting signal 1 receptor n=1 Tax=Gymnopilus junonius TaxID=109634 RepID=A0A9P5NS40_GYMJU|nr:hypothetical protein CPB84DRAFT_1677396 [Gymnopilus junonius]